MSERQPLVSRPQEEEVEEIVLAKTIGVVGKWQLEKAMLLALLQIVMGWHYLAYPLMSPEKPFHCIPPKTATSLMSNVTTRVSDDQCDVIITENGKTSQEPCTEWVFENDGRLSLREDFILVCERSSLLSIRQMIFFLGMVIGCLCTGHLSDKYGRKKTMLFLMTSWSVSSLLTVAVPSGYFTLFLILQFFLSLSAQSAFTISWTWTVEILGNGKWRTIVGLSTLYFWAIGFVTIAAIVYALPNWRWAFLAISLPTLLFANYAYLIPESPMWLISQGQVFEAQSILNEAAKRNGLPPVRNLAGILKTIENNNDESEEREKRFRDKLVISYEEIVPSETQPPVATGNTNDETYEAFLSMIRTPRIRECSLVFAFTWFATSFTYYGLSLNSGEVGGSGSLFLTFSLYGLMEFPAVTFATIVVLSLGRRLPIMLLIFVGGLACLGVAAISIGLPASPAASRSIVALAVIGKFCITANFHALFVYTSEVYATPTRNTALSICSVFASTGGMVAPFIAQTSAIHPTVPIAVFGVVSVIAGFLMSFLPETKGRPMPQTVTECEDMWSGDTFWNTRVFCCRRKSAARSGYEAI